VIHNTDNPDLDDQNQDGQDPPPSYTDVHHHHITRPQAAEEDHWARFHFYLETTDNKVFYIYEQGILNTLTIICFTIFVRLASPSPTLHRKVGEGAQHDKISNTIIFYLEIGFIS
jgi:hypothetical protein